MTFFGVCRWYACTFVCRLISVHVCVCVWCVMHIDVCLELTSSAFLGDFSLYLLRPFFFSGYRTQIMVDLYSWFAPMIAPVCLPSAGTKSGCHACIAFCVCTRGPNSTLHAYTLSTLFIRSHSACPFSGLILQLSIPFAEAFLETLVHYSC